MSFSRTDARLYMYYQFVWSNLNLIPHFPMDHLPRPVTSYLILLLCLFAAFAHYVIRRFVYDHITYVCYFVASYQFLLSYDWLLLLINSFIN